MKVLLVNPGWDGVFSKKGKRYNRRWPPLSMLNCASILERNGIKVTLIDGRAGNNMINTATFAKDYDKIFLTSSPIDRWQCPNLDLEVFLNSIKSLDRKKLYIMGVHGTLMPEKLLELTNARAVIRGEPELTTLELCTVNDLKNIKGITCRNGKEIQSNSDREPLDLNSLPLPSYHLIDIGNYYYELLGDRFALLEGSRGCTYSCSFCLKTMYGNVYRKKSSDNIIREIEYLVSKIKARNIYFIDLEFTLNKDAVYEVCKYLMKKKYNLSWCCQTRADLVDPELLRHMKGAGCKLIHYGIESGSERILNLIRKGINRSQMFDAISMTKKAGIDTACFYLFGFPNETLEEMHETINFAKRLNSTYASFHIATPYHGTQLYNSIESKAIDNVRLKPVLTDRKGSVEANESLFPESCIIEGKEGSSTEGYTHQDLERLRDSAYKKYYLRPEYVISRLTWRNVNLLLKQFQLFLRFMLK